jgi:hypothetical protein
VQAGLRQPTAVVEETTISLGRTARIRLWLVLCAVAAFDSALGADSEGRDPRTGAAAGRRTQRARSHDGALTIRLRGRINGATEKQNVRLRPVNHVVNPAAGLLHTLQKDASWKSEKLGHGRDCAQSCHETYNGAPLRLAHELVLGDALRNVCWQNHMSGRAHSAVSASLARLCACVQRAHARAPRSPVDSPVLVLIVKVLVGVGDVVDRHGGCEGVCSVSQHATTRAGPLRRRTGRVAAGMYGAQAQGGSTREQQRVRAQEAQSWTRQEACFSACKI